MEQQEEPSESLKKSPTRSEQARNQLGKLLPLNRIINLIFHAISVAVNAITSYVHIPEIAIGPIVGSLITATATLMIGIFTLSNLFSEQFLYRPLLLQDSSNQVNLTAEHYRQSVLSTYLEKMTDILLDHKNSDIQSSNFLFRAMTQATLQEIDGKRKRYVIVLLLDAQLLNNSLLSLLVGADLSNSDLHNLNLNQVNLEQANLSKANFSKANLNHVNFRQADLSNADLSYADLRGAIFKKVKLDKTNFTNACYDVLTEFETNFDPNKQNMKKISSFDSCL
jgi:uncharacterized protein YjbI with pentapeptide repeats